MQCAGDEKSNVIDHISVCKELKKLGSRPSGLREKVAELGDELVGHLAREGRSGGVGRESSEEVAICGCELQLNIYPKTGQRQIYSAQRSHIRGMKRTIDGFALRQIVIMLSGEEAVPIPSNDALNVAVTCLVRGLENFRSSSIVYTHPLLTLKNKPSMVGW
jgi:hypothetical protein